ncbi:MAG: hypothetical protein WCR69_00535 [Sulfuricurvum sp.]|jgi:hypothetical protein
MLKKIVMATLLTLSSTAMAQEFNLKENMLQLNAEMLDVRNGFMISDPDLVKVSILKFQRHVLDLLGDKKTFEQMLPKAQKHKAGEAIMSANIINYNVEIILDTISNKKNQSGLTRREVSQRAYSYIEQACFRCHNLVRDKY